MNILNSKKHLISWLVGCRVKANCPRVRPGAEGGVLSVGVFLEGPNTVFHPLLSEMIDTNSQKFLETDATTCKL